MMSVLNFIGSLWAASSSNDGGKTPPPSKSPFASAIIDVPIDPNSTSPFLRLPPRPERPKRKKPDPIIDTVDKLEDQLEAKGSELSEAREQLRTLRKLIESRRRYSDAPRDIDHESGDGDR